MLDKETILRIKEILAYNRAERQCLVNLNILILRGSWIDWEKSTLFLLQELLTKVIEQKLWKEKADSLRNFLKEEIL